MALNNTENNRNKAKNQTSLLGLALPIYHILGIFFLRLPCRQCAIRYTDFWTFYEKVLPKKRHRAVGKESGKNNHIARFNNTMRPRISRLVSQILSFSKKLENHIGAIWYFIHHYNAFLSV